MNQSKDFNKARFLHDADMMDESLRNLAATVTGKKETRYFEKTSELEVRALNEILRFFHRKPVIVPQNQDPIDWIFNTANISSRSVVLEGDWYKDAIGPYLGYTTQGDPVAILPYRNGYAYCDYRYGKRVPVNSSTAADLRTDAYCFYLPLPGGKLKVKDLFQYVLQVMSLWEIFILVAATAFASIIAMIIPAMTKLIFSGLIPSESFHLILPVATLLIFSMLSNQMIRMIRSLAVGIVNVRAGTALQAAAIGRVITLPVQFFRRYSAGEISERLQAIDRLIAITLDAVFSTGLTGVFSIVYIFQIHSYTPELVVPAILILLAKTVLALICTLIAAKRNKICLQKQSKLSGMMINILNGIQKIRLTGAENHIFARWAKAYTEIAALNYQPPKVLLYRQAILTLITMTGLAAINYIAAMSGVTSANYMAFNAAYGMVAGAFSAIVGIATTVSEFGPLVNQIRPILDSEPELEVGKKIPDTLTGTVQIHHLTFRYEKDAPPVLDDLSLSIKPGEYVAIVGATGCGKSTLMRLMLGFERAERGAIYYDQYNLEDLNLRGLRRKIGTVLQNGQLMPGSVFSNLSIARPNLTEQEAWDALEKAGLAADVRRMPMKLNTMLSENGGGISGGQKQRLLIARALVGNPAIIFMDEATSALDNVAQTHVVDALDQLNCTRVVIAHRLSTIQNCDRIIMLEGGRIIEEGNYDSLLEKRGRFAALVERQRL